MVTLDGCAGVVTGADGDFGREIALELAREGAHLLLLDDDADALKTLVIAIAADGRRSTSARVDSTDAFTLDSAIRSFEAEHRPFDFLVAATEEIESTGFGEGDPDRWHSLADVNILDALFAVRATLPSLLANGMGHIVLLGSVAGRKACRDAALYCATKRAVTDLGHALRAEGESPGVAATIVEPGASLLSDARSWLSHTQPESGGGMGRAAARTVVFVLTQPLNASITDVVVRGPLADNSESSSPGKEPS